MRMRSRRVTRSRGVTPGRLVLSRLAAAGLAVVLLLSATTVAGQEIPAGAAAVLTLELAADLAVGADNQVAVLQRHLQDQLDDLGIAGYLDDISLKLTGSMGGDVNTPLSASGSAVLSAGLENRPSTHPGEASTHSQARLA